MPSLIVVGSKKDQSELALDSSVTVIGRDRGVQVELSDFQVSRRHALVVRTDDGCFVKDLGSRNGVLVNSARVPSRRHQRLKNGDVLTLGRTALVYKEVEGPIDPAIVATIAVVAAAPKAPAAPAPAKGPAPANGRAHAGKGPAKADGKVAEVAEAKAAEAKAAEAKAAEAKVAEAKVAEAKVPAAPVAATPATPGADAAAAAGAPARTRFVELAADAEPTRGEQNKNDPAVRALLRRLEVERIFYRNLALALVSFLMLLVLVLLVFALRPHDKDERAGLGPTPTTRPLDQVAGGPATGGSLLRPTSPVALQLGRAGELDAHEFADTIVPLLRKGCATGGCHQSPAKGAGDLSLEFGTDAPSIEKSFASVKRFVVPGRPERSALLTKPLRRDEGGEGHGGGDVLAAESAEYQTIRAWIQRAAPPPELGPQLPTRRGLNGVHSEPTPDVTPDNPGSAGPPKTAHKPLARIAPPAGSPAVGTSIVLDGRTSVCPLASCALHHHWTLSARPQGSKAEIADEGAPLAHLVPDVAGSYTVSLVVSCDEGKSESVDLPLVATATAAAAPAAAALREAPEGRAWARALSIDLLGRAPTRDEGERNLAKTREQLVAELMARDETYAEWLEQECLGLGLVNEARPHNDVLTELAGRLKRHEATAADAIETLATAGFAPRNDAEKVVLTLLEALHGQDKPEPAFVDAARRMVEGQSSALLGKTGRSLNDLVKILASDRAFAVHLARRTWLRLTGQVLDADALEQATRRLMDAGPKGDQAPTAAFFDIMRDWLVTPRYLERGSIRRPKTERVFIRTLFQDAIGRTPDEEELRSARRSLRSLADKAPLRAALAKLLLDSPQARISTAGDGESFVRGQFEQLLARTPRERELAAFTRVLSNGATRDSVVRALLTSAEYATY